MEEKYQNQFLPPEEEEVCEDDAQEEAPQAPVYPLTGRQKLRRTLPVAIVYARYLLPLLSAAVLLISGFLYAVRGVNVGRYYEVSIWRLYANTFSGVHDYLGTEGNMRADGLYTTLSIGAIVGILVLILAVFLNVLAAVCALRSFRAGEKNDVTYRMKIKFNIAFPNRFCLFLANLLLLVPAAYPNFYSSVSQNYMLVGATNVFYVTLNRPLIVLGVLALLTLVLAIVSARYEKRKHMDMFDFAREDK